MVKALISATVLSAIVLLGFGASTQASPSATSKQAATSSTHDYWLSDRLNRLVFWQPPAVSPQTEKKSAP